MLLLPLDSSSMGHLNVVEEVVGKSGVILELVCVEVSVGKCVSG